MILCADLQKTTKLNDCDLVLPPPKLGPNIKNSPDLQ